MLKGLFFYTSKVEGLVYGEVEIEAITRYVELTGERLERNTWRQHKDRLAEVEVIFSSWGPPYLDEEFLAAAPRLKYIFHAAGSVKDMMTDAAWQRGIGVSSAYAANAIPVAEFTLSQILFCLKNGWQLSRQCMTGDVGLWRGKRQGIGAYGSKVGLISLGMIGRRVCHLLRGFDLEVLAYDIRPFTAVEQEQGVTPASVETIFRTCDCVSLHAPLLSQTTGMIRGEHFAMMKHGASFINTARGAIVQQDEMIEVLKGRPDLTVVLDVVDPEPPDPHSALFHLPNVFLTPHIAGAKHGERRRLGQYMSEELQRYVAGERLRWSINHEASLILA